MESHDSEFAEAGGYGQRSGFWPVRHPGIGIIYYGSEQEARAAAGTAAEMLPPEQVELSTAGVDLTALAALGRAGTPAPWHIERDGQELRVESVVEGDVIATWTRAECDIRDPELIVAARNALPELLAEVQRLSNELAMVTADRDRYRAEAADALYAGRRAGAETAARREEASA